MKNTTKGSNPFWPVPMSPHNAGHWQRPVCASAGADPSPMGDKENNGDRHKAADHVPLAWCER